MKIVGFSIHQSWVLLFACGASSAILSFSITGHPYITGFLPHALAIWITLNNRIRKNWLLTFFLCLAANELSWHLYDLGRTVFVVFVAAALVQKDVRFRIRVVWLIASAVQLAMVLTYKGGGVGDLLTLNRLEIHNIGTAILNLGEALFISEKLDIPILFILGIVSFFFFKSRRWFLFVLLVLQMGLVFMLAMRETAWLRPRRFLVVDFYCILAITHMLREAEVVSRYGNLIKKVALGVLLIGNIWQMANLLNYVKIPIKERIYPLPFTYSRADYMIPHEEVDWYLDMRRRVETGEKLLLIYSFHAYPENTTDPATALERLYSSLGHKRFMESVFVFASALNVDFHSPPGAIQCRYSCVPMHPLTELSTFLDSVRSGGAISPEKITVYYLQIQVPTYQHVFASESAKIFEEIRKRFEIRLDSPKESKYMRFKIAEKKVLLQNFIIEPTEYKYQQGTIEKPFYWRELPLDIVWVADPPGDTSYVVKRPWEDKPFALRLSGILHIVETGLYDFLVGSDDGIVLKLDGKVIIDNSGAHYFQLMQKSLVLDKGEYTFEIIYTDVGAIAHLLVDINQIGEGSHQKNKDQIFNTVSINKLFPKGLAGRYYQGTNWTGESKPIGEEIHLGESLEVVWTDSSGLSQKPWPAFSLRLEGKIKIPEPGIYQFYLMSDDGSLLYLDGALVLDNGGLKPRIQDREKYALLYLRAGEMAFKLDYYDVVGEALLKLTVKQVKMVK